jgi:hypothetical protein
MEIRAVESEGRVEELADVGDGLIIARVAIADLKEQDVNAQSMEAREFERLVENIRKRGAPESLPYCAWPGREGPVEIISGHHRTRATRAAGFKQIVCLIDTRAMTRSEKIAKQLAHNALVGASQASIIGELLKMIDNPDDMLATGLPPELLPSAAHDAIVLFTPRIDFGWKTVTFTFLPHQLANLESLMVHLDGRQDLVGLAREEQWEKFLTYAAKFARVRDIRSAGMTIAALTEIALAKVEEAEQAAAVTEEARVKLKS